MEFKAVVEYLGGYPWSGYFNHRITNIDKHRVSFRFTRTTGRIANLNHELQRLSSPAGLLAHTFPPGFRRMRHYGILSNFHKARARLHAASE